MRDTHLWEKVWNKDEFQMLRERFFSRSELAMPQARSGYTLLKYCVSLSHTEHVSESDAFAMTELNGYQLAFYALNQTLIEPARDQAVVHSYQLKLIWPAQRDAADLELFYEGLHAAAEQLGFLLGAVSAVLGCALALSFETWALREEKDAEAVAEIPEASVGDVLWVLTPPGEAAAGMALLRQREAFLDIDEVYRERLIQAYLQAPPLLHVARLLKQAGLPVAAQPMRQGLSRAARRLVPLERFGVKAASLTGSGALNRLARLCGDDGSYWIYEAADSQLLWRSPGVHYEETRSLIWKSFELETMEVGRVVEDYRMRLEPPEAAIRFAEEQDLNR